MTAKRGELPRFPAANVVARSEIDHEIERSTLKGKIPDVGLENCRIDSLEPHSLISECYEIRIDVYTYELARTKSCRQNR